MKKLNLLKLLTLIIFTIIIVLLLTLFDVRYYLNPSVLRDYITGFGVLAPMVFILIYILATLFFIPATPLTLLSGIVFGKLFGTVWVIVGATIGSTLAFLFARYLGRDFIKNKIEKKFEKIKEYDKKLEENGFVTVLFLRLVPFFPFNGLNFALGLTKLELRDFFFATLIGIIPGTFVYVYLGNSLFELSPLNILFAILLLIILFSIMPIYKKLRKKN